MFGNAAYKDCLGNITRDPTSCMVFGVICICVLSPILILSEVMCLPACFWCAPV